MHLIQVLHQFPMASSMDFVDTGISVFNKDLQERVYFIKMILLNDITGTREIYIMGLAAEQLGKWETHLKIC